MKFLFWNCGRQSLGQTISKLAHHLDVDVVILAEIADAPAKLLTILNKDATVPYDYSLGQCERIRIFTRFAGEYAQPVFEASRHTIRRLHLPAKQDILLVAAHLPSPWHLNESSRNASCTELAYDIRHVERQEEHMRTVVVGDLNLNPFDAGVVNADGLHGVISKRIAVKGSRTVTTQQVKREERGRSGVLPKEVK